MTTTTSKTLAAFALLAAVAAGGSTDPSGTTPSGSPPHSTASVMTPRDVAAARQVTVVRSGGLRPVRVTLVFANDKPAPEGFTRAEVAAVLKAAADPELKTQPPTKPGNTCCDLYLYRVSIAWPDGTSAAFTAVDGGSSPPALAHLLTLAT